MIASINIDIQSSKAADSKLTILLLVDEKLKAISVFTNIKLNRKKKSTIKLPCILPATYHISVMMNEY